VTDMSTWAAVNLAWLTQLIVRLIGAVIIWYVGIKIASLIVRLVVRTVDRQVPAIDDTTLVYGGNTVSVAIKIVLGIVVLGFLGIETTSFAALLAAAGLAIGAAWSGLLANFAAGVFLIILRPFTVGDHIEGAGVRGTVKEIGIFVTTVDTPDNVRTFIATTSCSRTTSRTSRSIPSAGSI
jgi:small conductance mechanosensitive channel